MSEHLLYDQWGNHVATMTRDDAPGNIDLLDSAGALCAGIGGQPGRRLLDPDRLSRLSDHLDLCHAFAEARGRHPLPAVGHCINPDCDGSGFSVEADGIVEDGDNYFEDLLCEKCGASWRVIYRQTYTCDVQMHNEPAVA